MVCLFIPKSFAIFVFLVLTLFFSSHHHQLKIFALRIISINPQQFDPKTRIIEIPYWPLPGTNSDFSSDSDGGIIYFDGALAENTTLIISGVVAKRIEINATMSAGCTLIVENCRLFNSSSVGENTINNGSSSNDPVSGGLLISPTIFPSFSADDFTSPHYACSKVVFPSASSSLKVQIIIRNNIITSYGEVNQLSAPSIASPFAPYFMSPIIISNLIICKNPNNGDSGEGVSLDLVISNNNISISTSADYPNGISIYMMHRNRKSLLTSYLNAAVGSAVKDLYDVIIPISAITISNNSISVDSVAASTTLAGVRAIMIGSWTDLSALGVFKTHYSYIFLKNDSNVIFDFSANRIFVDGCVIACALFLADIVGANTLPTSPPLMLQPPQPRFVINFHHHPLINITSTARSIGLDLMTMQNLIRYNIEINFYNNYDVRLTQTDPKTTGGAVSGLRTVQFFSPSNFTNVTVMNSIVSFNGGNSDDKTVLRSHGSGLGHVLIKNVSLTMINDPRFRSYRVNASNRVHARNFECGFFTNYVVPNIHNFTAEDNQYVDLGNTNNSAILFAFYGYATAQATSSLDGTWGVSSMGSVVVRNNRVHSVSRSNFGFIYWAVLARVGNVLIENNTMLGEAFLPWVIRKSVTSAVALRFNKCIIRGNSVQFRACDICATLDSNFEFIFMSYFLLESTTPGNSNNNQNEDIEKNSNFIVENNTIIAHGFRTAVFFRGGYMAGGDYLPGRTTLVRNNLVTLLSREQSTFLFQPVVVSDPEKFYFGMKNIVIDSNVVRLVSRQAASFWVSSAAPESTARSVLYVNGTFACDLVATVTNNVVNSTAGVLGFLLGLTNLKLNSIVLNNNTFDMAVNTVEPPISPSGIPVALISREYRFSVFSDSTLKYFNLTTSADSTLTPACSFLNGVPIKSKLVRTFVYQKANILLQQLLGRGSLTGDFTLNSGACGYTRTQTQHESRNFTNTTFNNTTNNTIVRRTRTQTSFVPHSKKSSPLSTTVGSLSSTATLALGSLAASSSMAAAPVRTRAVLLGVAQILNDDCGGSFTIDFLEEAPPLSSSPTQMYFSSSTSRAGAGGGGYASGAIIGNTILILASLIVWILATFFAENYVIPFMKKRRNLASNNSGGKNNTSTTQGKKKYPSLKYVLFTLKGFAQSRAMVPAVNFGLMFLDPMFTSAIALIMMPEVGVGWKVVGIFLSIVLLLCCFFFVFVIYYLMISRRTVERFFSMRRYQQFQNLNNGKSIHTLKRLWNFLMEPEGEWRCPKIGMSISTTNQNRSNNDNAKSKNVRNNEPRNNTKSSSSSNSYVTKHDVILWRLVEPAIDGFTSAFPRFTICDVLIVVALALSSVIGQATQNCTVMGVLMIISVGIHCTMALYFRPDQERLLKVLIPLMGAIQIVLLVVALVGGMANVGVVEPLATILVILQMFLTALWIISIGLSLVEFTKSSSSVDDANKREGNQSSDMQMMARKLKGEENKIRDRRDNENNRGLLGIPALSSSSPVSRNDKIKNDASFRASSSSTKRKGEQNHQKDQEDSDRPLQNNYHNSSRSSRSDNEKRKSLSSGNDEFRRSSSSTLSSNNKPQNNNNSKSREQDQQRNSTSSSRNGTEEKRHLSSNSISTKNQKRKSGRVVDETI